MGKALGRLNVPNSFLKDGDEKSLEVDEQNVAIEEIDEVPEEEEPPPAESSSSSPTTSSKLLNRRKSQVISSPRILSGVYF